MTALVFNCHYNGLAIIQELGRHGVPVVALDSERGVGTRSRYARFIPTIDPSVSPERFVDHLVRLGPTFPDRPVLFPTNDPWALAIARHRETLAQFYEPCVADGPTVDLLLDKELFYQKAEELGYPVPKTWRHSQLPEVESSDFPIVAKPVSRNLPMTGDVPDLKLRLNRLRFTVLRDRAALARFIDVQREVLPALVFQQFVEGQADCMYTVGVYANRANQVLGVFTGRKLRGFPPDAGNCMVGQVEIVPRHMVELTTRICAELGYQGIAEFEFKRDERSGEFYLIEINPRSWSWIGITPACGVSLPWIAYTDLTQPGTVEFAESRAATGSVKWVRPLDDLANVMLYNRRTGFPEWSLGPLGWWRSIRSGDVIYAGFAKDDPGAALHTTAAQVKRLARSAFRWRK